MRRKTTVVLTAALVLGLLAAALPILGCGGSDKQLQDRYSEGYEAGVKAEQAKWSAEKLKLAQTYIEEQRDSQENVVRLLRGDITGFTVDSVAVDDAAGRSKIYITAVFRDGTQYRGVIDVIKIDSFWYVERVTHSPS